MLDIIPTKKEIDLRPFYHQNVTVKIDDYYHRKLNSSKSSSASMEICNVECSLSPNTIITGGANNRSTKKNNFGKIKQFTKRILSTLASSFSSSSAPKNNNDYNNKKIDTINTSREHVNADGVVEQEEILSTKRNSHASPDKSDYRLKTITTVTATKRSAHHLEFDHKSLFDKALKLTNVDNVFNNGPKVNASSLMVWDSSVSDGSTKLHPLPNFQGDHFNTLLNTTDSTLSLSFVVQYIEMGRYRFETWYKSFYPQERISHDGGIHLCDRCLVGLRPGSFYQRHHLKCPIVRPPGKVVKRQGNRTIYEIDGKSGAADYCRNLCLLSMFFISGKVAYHEVDHFVFYVLTVTCNEKNNEEELVGYFSRDKDTELNHTMSCLFILPPHMKQGHGSFLIEYSYRVAKSLGIIGSPEKPLSTTGLIAFRSYWWRVLSNYLKTKRLHSKISIKDISTELGIAEIDIISTLQYLGKIKKVDDNYYIVK